MMKAQSQAQQKAAGAALAAKRGKISRRKLKGASRDMVETMTESELRDMASTKHAGKPERVTDT
jgi:hypothetical protein